MEEIKKNIVINSDKKTGENSLMIKIKYFPTDQNSTLNKNYFTAKISTCKV